MVISGRYSPGESGSTTPPVTVDHRHHGLCLFDVLPPCRETLPIHSILHIVSYKVGLMLCWYTPWVGHITI